MRVLRRRMTNIAKLSVEAVAEITMQMNFGLAVTSAKDGSTANA